MYNTDDNVFVGAPSGSGKSVIAEFALLRLLSQDPNGRAVYLLPKDALADIVFADWYHKFGQNFNIKVFKNIYHLRIKHNIRHIEFIKKTIWRMLYFKYFFSNIKKFL